MTRLSVGAWCSLLVGVFLILVAVSSGADAQPIERSQVPAELKGWIPWVVHDVPDYRCSYIVGGTVCSWPGELVLELDQRGGRFEFYVTNEREHSVLLPGNADNWPLEVRVDGRSSVVVDDGSGKPSTLLEAGSRQIRGRFLWSQLPDRMSIPPRTALVHLTVDGKPLYNPRRGESGELWLESAVAPEKIEETDRVDLDVYRRIVDGVPLMVSTFLRVRVAGKPRELDLGPVLLEGFTVREVSGDVPARLDPQGNLKLQARAGEYQVSVVAHSEHNPGVLTVPAKAEPWPAVEIWSWKADDALRQVNLTGAPGIDTSRTKMPEEWSELPAYQLQQEQSLSLEAIRRGIEESPPDHLTLQRTMLLDFDGHGYTVSDSLSGKLSQTQRLDLEVAGVLGNATVDGDEQLITAHPETGLSGIELRKTQLDMRAHWRMEAGARQVPAVGWSRDVQKLEASLVLPPGWTLLGVSGVDQVRGTWWGSWNLWIFFVVLVIALALAKLTRWYYGFVTLVMLVLCHNQSGSPLYIWLTLAVTLTLLQVITRGRLAYVVRMIWWVVVFSFALTAVPFAVQQIREGIYPQIGGGARLEYGVEMEEPVQHMGATDRSKDSRRYKKSSARGEKAEAGNVGLRTLDSMEADVADGGSGPRGIGRAAQYDDEAGRLAYGAKGVDSISLQQQVVETGAVVQTGPGLPEWSWGHYPLHFSGPVKKDHQIQLYLLTPQVNLALAIARVLLVIFVGGILFRRALALRAHRKPDATVPNPGAAAVTLLFVLGTLTCWTSDAVASTTPDEARLNELKERITARADCHPHCMSTASLQVAIVEERVALRAEVHAGEQVGWPLPGPAENWQPERITVNGRPSKELLLHRDGFYYLRLEPGVNAIRASSPLPQSGVLTLEFENKPRGLRIDAPGWDVEGVAPDGRIEDSIRLSRSVAPSQEAEVVRGGDEVHYPPWFTIQRVFSFGIEWQVATRVTRETPTGSQAFLRMPLLPGEQVNSPDVQVENGEAVISFGRDDEELEWISTLEHTNWMQLTAATDQPWNEIWELRCSSIWPCAPSGIAPIAIEQDGMFVSEYRPYPGERIEVAFAKPQGVEGQSITIDSTRLTVRPGVRLAAYRLEIQVRTSNGGSQKVSLPEGAQIERVTADGHEKTFRKDGSSLEISLEPGQQTLSVAWQQDGGISPLLRVPTIGLGQPGVNAVQEIELDSERWIILAGGPDWGPAVLFWGFFIAVILAAVLLGRVWFSPLSSLQWALLAIGLTQVPVAASLIIVAWFLIMALREKSRFAEAGGLHNFLQLVLVLFTVVAAGCLLAAVYTGLAVQPDMQIAGGYGGGLSWYSDRVGNDLPQPWVLSVPIGIWKLIMLAWALWLAASLIKWGPWAFRAFSSGGAWASRQE